MDDRFHVLVLTKLDVAASTQVKESWGRTLIALRTQLRGFGPFLFFSRPPMLGRAPLAGTSHLRQSGTFGGGYEATVIASRRRFDHFKRLKASS